jgi:hypothetical protein
VPKSISSTGYLVPTFAVVISLARTLCAVYPGKNYHFFLDNLFLNISVALALLELGILCTGTTRKNATGVPNWLVELKTRNRSLLWDSAFAEIVNGVLCFLWQDNNAVLGITTGFDLAQRVLRLRKRPSLTSINARIVRPVFGDEPRKLLWIPKVIDEYNHHMNSVDLANQYRKPMTTNRPQEHRVWHPLWHFCVDVAAVNSYICWRYGRATRQHKQRPFRQKLVEALLSYPLDSEAYAVTAKAVDRWPGHSWTRFDKRSYCIWCQTHPRHNLRRRRQVLGDITNQVISTHRIRPGATRGGCSKCKAPLCASGSCFRKYHSSQLANAS